MITGPCSAESEDQTLATARQLASFGIKVFRAGIWKPRTRPGCFEGVGSIGFPWLRKVKEETGMLTAVEVGCRKHVEEAIEGDTDILWVGARTTTNPFAVQEIADAVAVSGKDLTIFVKNPTSPDLEQWIGALERFHNAGVRRLGAIHRGFFSYGKHLYRNIPIWRIPIELRRRMPELPIFCDPSHIGGSRDLIAPLSQQAIDMGFNGLMIESHCNPDSALSDSRQQVTPLQLKEILDNLIVRDSDIPEESLSDLRNRIDKLDDELLEILCKRMEVSREIGQYKKEHRIPVVQMKRHDEIMKKRIQMAEKMGMSRDFMRNLLSSIHEESVRQQIDD